MAATTHLPFAYQLGPLEITGFGLGMLLAFVIGQIVATAVLERRGQDGEVMGDVTVGAVIGGLVGAKLYYAILTGDPGAVFSRAGFVFWGGLIGGIIAVALVIRHKGRRFTEISD
ncbi:MAG: prolipoprotein diacylglyceryl transferase family protein, partial [Gemmatimonadota bacterium]